MSKKEKSESKDLVSIPQHDGTLDVSSRSDMENWVARQELINRVSVFFFGFVSTFSTTIRVHKQSYDRVAKFNFALTYVSMMKSAQIERNLDDLETDMGCVRTGLEKQSGIVSGIENELQDLSNQMKRQQAAIDAQEVLVAKLGDSKLKQDALIDLASALLAIFLSGSPIVDFPLQIVSAMSRSMIRGRQGRRRLNSIVFIVRFAIFCVITLWLRRVAARSGLHSFVGGPSSYAKMILNYTRARLSGVRSMKKGAEEEKKSD